MDREKYIEQLKVIYTNMYEDWMMDSCSSEEIKWALHTLRKTIDYLESK